LKSTAEGISKVQITSKPHQHLLLQTTTLIPKSLMAFDKKYIGTLALDDHHKFLNAKLIYLIFIPSSTVK
jgi:hypothetical protein